MLDPDQLTKIRMTLQTSGWNDVMKPAIQDRGRSAVKALVLTRSERATAYKGSHFDTEDDVLRAIIHDAEWLAVCWDNELQVAEYNRRRDELDRQQDDTGANPQ